MDSNDDNISNDYNIDDTVENSSNFLQIVEKRQEEELVQVGDDQRVHFVPFR